MHKGKEPHDHSHPTEDEIFCVLKGELTFRYGGESFDIGGGGFIYLPQRIERGYTVRSEKPVRLILVTFPASAAVGEGWGGFIAAIQRQGDLIAKPEHRSDSEEVGEMI